LPTVKSMSNQPALRTLGSWQFIHFQLCNSIFNHWKY
jgi:hypothetical protein